MKTCCYPAVTRCITDMMVAYILTFVSHLKSGNRQGSVFVFCGTLEHLLHCFFCGVSLNRGWLDLCMCHFTPLSDYCICHGYLPLTSTPFIYLPGTLMILKSACSYNASYIDRLISVFMRSLQKMVREHLSPQQANPGVTETSTGTFILKNRRHSCVPTFSKCCLLRDKDCCTKHRYIHVVTFPWLSPYSKRDISINEWSCVFYSCLGNLRSTR